MAFKSVEQFNDDRYRGLFRLVNNGDTADVVFLYRSKKEELVGDVHYVRSKSYNGYVQCCDENCPACAKGLKLQHRLFVPLYNVKQHDAIYGDLQKGVIEFWDRTVNFDKQLEQDVFSNYPNPSEYVFRIKRNGEPNDIETKYEIQAIAKNNASIGSYDDIMAKFQTSFPKHYNEIAKEVTVSELSAMLADTGSVAGADLPDYTPIPRAGYQSSIPDTFVNASEAVEVPSAVPTFDAVSTEASIDTDVATDGSEDDTDLPDPIF